MDLLWFVYLRFRVLVFIIGRIIIIKWIEIIIIWLINKGLFFIIISNELEILMLIIVISVIELFRRCLAMGLDWFNVYIRLLIIC